MATQIPEFKFECPYCGQHLAAELDLMGMEIVCPACGKILIVPSPDSTYNIKDPAEEICQSTLQTEALHFSNAKPKNPLKTTIFAKLITAINHITSSISLLIKKSMTLLTVWTKKILMLIQIQIMRTWKYHAVKTYGLVAKKTQTCNEKNILAIVAIVVLVIVGLLNVGILCVGVYLGWHHIKTQDAAREASMLRQAEHDAAELRQSKEAQERRQAEMAAELRREKEAREQRQAEMAAQLITQLMINENANRQRTSMPQPNSDWQRITDALVEPEIHRRQVYEDEMIRQRARQNSSYWW